MKIKYIKIDLHLIILIILFQILLSFINPLQFNATQNNRSPSLMLTLFRASWPMLLLSGFFRLVGDCLAFVGPLLIERIVNYAYEEQEGDLSSPLPFANDTTTIKPPKVGHRDPLGRNRSY